MAAKKSSQRKSIPSSKSTETVMPTSSETKSDTSPPVISQETEQLRAQLKETEAKLVAITAEKDLLSAEVEELTKTLFEEANGMVAMEAQARWHVEQAQKRLESELAKTLEMLALESEQTKFLRQLVEQEKSQQRQQDPFLWDIDMFSARLAHDYYEDFYPSRQFNSRERSASQEWDRLSTHTASTWQFKQFSQFLDDCILKNSPAQKRLDDDSLLTLFGHPFMRSVLSGDIEPCLTFPVLDRAARTKSLLKKLLPAMFKNTCVIEPLPRDIPDSTSQRASPVGSIRSFKSVSRPPSPLKDPESEERKEAHKRENEDASPTVAIDIPLSPKTIIPPPATTTTSASPSSLSKSPASLLSRFDSYLSSLVSESTSPTTTTSPVNDRCAFCDCQHSPTAFRFRINNSSVNDSPTKSATWTPLCRGCRDRLVAVASLFTLLRHLLQGHQSHRPKIDIYFDVLQAKRFMFYARAGADQTFYALSDFESFCRKLQ